MNLLIVESPTKAKTISRFLPPRNFKIVSSFGHIRDLPKSKLGVDVENNFQPTYLIPAKAKPTVAQLKNQAQKTNAIYYATDQDREGEAIAWHLSQILQPKSKKKKIDEFRITFHEITKPAILDAIKKPRQIDMDLVNAQQARRILDRLVGYKLSPFLWKKITRGLSAGRVQSVALRLIVEREREIEKFKAEEYWSIEGIFEKYLKQGGETKRELAYKETKRQLANVETKHASSLLAKLYAIDNKKLAKFDLKTKEQVEKLIAEIKKHHYQIKKIERQEKTKNPYPPYTTSTLQQDANRRLGFSAKKTMFIAQKLYEGMELGQHGATGLITYMRTDSVSLADKFLQEAKNYLKNNLGKKYALHAPRRFKTKSKSAQEAHEAIRPTDPAREPEALKNHLDNSQYKLYQLIWQRAMASQMPPAIVDSTTVDIENFVETTRRVVSTQKRNDQKPGKKNFRSMHFLATGSILKFDGFLKIYPMKIDENELPDLQEQEPVDLKELKPDQHFTEPPPLYTDASLVKELEKRGIGRPSTYAPTISTIEARNYIERIESKKMKPTELGILVCDVLCKHFTQIMDYDFTAEMEDSLDKIATNKSEWVPIIKKFWDPFNKNLSEKYQEVKKSELTQTKLDEVCEKCGKKMVIKMGRYGKFAACSGFPGCKNTHPIEKSKINPPDGRAGNQKSKNSQESVINTSQDKNLSAPNCEKCGKEMVLKEGRFGRFWGCSGYPDCQSIKAIEDKIGMICPDCQIGEVIRKKTRKGRFFYGCNQYPKCHYASWQNPKEKTEID